MIRRPPKSTQSRSSAASDVYKRQGGWGPDDIRLEGLEHEVWVAIHVYKPVVHIERFGGLLALGFAMKSHGSHAVGRLAVEPAMLALHGRLNLCQKLAADASSPPGLLRDPDTVDDGHADAHGIAVGMALDHADRVSAIVGDPGKRAQLVETIADPLSLGLGCPFP